MASAERDRMQRLVAHAKMQLAQAPPQGIRYGALAKRLAAHVPGTPMRLAWRAIGILLLRRQARWVGDTHLLPPRPARRPADPHPGGDGGAGPN